MWVFGDRVFVVIPIVLVFLGIRPDGIAAKFALFLAILVPLIITMPHRMGVCIGLDYVWRARHEGS